ncbi:hypothetical protein lerEdw1_009602 [Lerista edwardsae]|nr:hypothetical protein lerEdw1_009602 [Lerista edwardsae]
MGWSEVAAMYMTVFSVLVLVTAVMDHHWIFVQAPTQNYYSGIWKVCTRLTCTSIIAISPNVRSARALLVLALFCAFVGSSFMIFTYRYFFSYSVYRYLVSAMGSFLTAMSVYTIRVAMHGNTKTTRITYQWAFYLAWSSCPFFILSGENEECYGQLGLFGLMAHSHSPIQRLSFSDESMTLSSTSISSSSYLDDEPKHSRQPSENKTFGVVHT